MSYFLWIISSKLKHFFEMFLFVQIVTENGQAKKKYFCIFQRTSPLKVMKDFLEKKNRSTKQTK